ncbi:MAG: hypothetical protein V1695_00395 [Candidatus Uhrbacteria bacterium]
MTISLKTAKVADKEEKMERNLLILILSITCLLPVHKAATQENTVSVAAANTSPLGWAGFEIQPYLATQIPVVKDRLAVRSVLVYFGNSSSKASIGYAYFGPSFLPADWVTISPMIGLVNGWFEYEFEINGETETRSAPGFIASLWMDFNFEHEHVQISAQIDGYFNHELKQAELYCFYRASYLIKPYLNVGIQAEQVYQSIILGPHLGTTFGPFHAELQYYLVPETSAHSLRLVTGLGF